MTMTSRTEAPTVTDTTSTTQAAVAVSMVVEVDDVQTFLADPAVEQALLNSLSAIVGVPPSVISVSLSAAGRHLQGGSVQVDYVIRIPQSITSVQDVMDTVAQTPSNTLTAVIEAEISAQAGSGSHTVSVVSATAVELFPTTTQSSSTQATTTPVLCVGNADTWDAGYGRCSSYADGMTNHYYCRADSSQGFIAMQVCSECGGCEMTTTTTTNTVTSTTKTHTSQSATGTTVTGTATTVTLPMVTFDAVDPNWADHMDFTRSDSRFARRGTWDNNNDGGSWSVDGTTLSLAWDQWGVTSLTTTDGGHTFEATSGLTLTIGDAPAWWLQLFEGRSEIAGAMTVANVDFAALDSNPSLKAAFETECQSTIADAAGTSPESVEVTLASGSVRVEYTIVLPASSGAAASTALATAVSGDLATDLVSALTEIPGIDEVVAGTMAVTSIEAPTVTETEATPAVATQTVRPIGQDEASPKTGSTQVAVMGVLMGSAAALAICALVYRRRSKKPGNSVSNRPGGRRADNAKASVPKEEELTGEEDIVCSPVHVGRVPTSHAGAHLEWANQNGCVPDELPEEGHDTTEADMEVDLGLDLLAPFDESDCRLSADDAEVVELVLDIPAAGQKEEAADEVVVDIDGMEEDIDVDGGANGRALALREDSQPKVFEDIDV
jgi:LPXTG-motif cell wall-anchored protein